MISSQIAKKSGSLSLLKTRSSSRVRTPKSNPQLLIASDSITLSGTSGLSNGIQSARATITTSSTMKPLGSERVQDFKNSGSGHEVTTKTSVAKYANPPAVEFQGQMWAIS